MSEKQEFICPFCQQQLQFSGGLYTCNRCKFTLPSEISGYRLEEREISAILSDGYSSQIDNFHDQFGKKFKGRILLLNGHTSLLSKSENAERCQKCQSTDTYQNENFIWCCDCHWSSVKRTNTEILSDGYHPDFKPEPEQNEQSAAPAEPNLQHYDVFISHSSQDDSQSLAIYDYLTRNGVKCWIDKRNISPGTVYSEEIARGLVDSKIFLAVFSAKANESRPILDEVIAAYNEHKIIIVYNIDKNINVRNIKPGFKLPFGSPQWISDHSPAQHKQALEMLLLSIQRSLQNISGNEDSPDKTDSDGGFLNLKKSILVKLMRSIGKTTITAVLFLAMSLFAYHIYFSRTDSEPQGAATDAPGKNRLIQSSKQIHRSVNKSAGTEESEFNVGSILRFGKYWDHPLDWIYAFDDESGNQVFISREIITFKPFDVAHSNLYGRIANGFVIEMFPTNKDTIKSFSERLTNDDWIRAYGENNWEYSTLRAWLNSGKISVQYPEVRPSRDNANVYSESGLKYGIAYTHKIDEPGFLTGFSQKEQAALLTNSTRFALTDYHKNEHTEGDHLFNYFEELDPKVTSYKRTLMPKVRPFIFNLDNIYTKTVEDRIYLPSLPEFIKISQDSRIDLEYSKEVFTSNGESYILPNSQWWLRTPCGFLNTTVCTVEGSDLNKGKAILRIATSSDLIGVRPLMKLNTRKLRFTGSGTLADPYQLKDR